MIAQRASRGADCERVFRVKVETRDDEHRIGGIGAPYDEWTVLWESERTVWREKYARGCFDESIADDDVQCCFNHKPDQLIASTRNSSLTLNSTKRGLEFESRLDMEDPDSQRVWAKIRSGLVNGASTSFRVRDDDGAIKHEEYKRDGKWYFDDTIKAARLFEVGPVTNPAYENTSSEVRNQSIRELDAFMRSLKRAP